ncbi:hypothetical protein HYO45_22545 [Vibrio parahaemolyticus]|nr:hypothetical protein [Vibrio parahaemolyticus]
MDKKLEGSILGDGAEYYVAAQIMLNLKMLVSIAPTAAPSWDLEVTNPINGKSAKVQVKYRTRRNNDSPHTRLRNGINFDFLVLVESSLPAEISVLSEEEVTKKWALGLQNCVMDVYPIWIVTRDEAHRLLYKSINKEKGFMVKSFRTPEHLYKWDKFKKVLE